MLQSAKLAASEFGYNRTATANEAEETNGVAVNENDGDAGDDDDDDERVERNADYEGEEEEKADFSDSVESGFQRLFVLGRWSRCLCLPDVCHSCTIN